METETGCKWEAPPKPVKLQVRGGGFVPRIRVYTYTCKCWEERRLRFQCTVPQGGFKCERCGRVIDMRTGEVEVG